VTLELLAVGLAGIGAARPEPRARALLFLAALGVGLAAAALVAAFGSSSLAGMADWARDPETLGLLHFAGGLVLLGLVVALLSGPRWSTLVVLAIGGGLSLPFARLPGAWRVVGIAAGVLSAAVLGWIILTWLRPGRILVALDRVLFDRAGRGAWQPAVGWMPDAPVLVAAGAGIVALVVPHLFTVLGGVIIATIAGWLAASRAGRRPWPLLVAATLVFLILLWTVRLSGPLGGWIPALVDGPFSPRAAQWLGAMTAGAALILAGQWPWHGAAVPILLAPLAVAVVGGFGVRLIPDGLQWWQPILAPLTLMALMHAAAHRRMPAFLVAAGLFGLWTGTLAGTGGGAALVGVGWILFVAPVTWLGRLNRPRAVAGLGGMFVAAAGILVLRAGLATEVGYSLVGTMVVATAVATTAEAHLPRAERQPAVAARSGADHISR